MHPDTVFFVSLSAAIAGLVGFLARLVLVIVLPKRRPAAEPYAQRLSRLTSTLRRASSEVDAVLRDMTRVASEREASTRALEAGLADLEARQEEAQERIAVLESVPVPVAEYFARLVARIEGRSARRDYLLFVSGVLVTTIVALVLRLALGA